MVVIGIDPHKGSHSAVAMDEDERKLDEVRVRADRRQLERLWAWPAAFLERSWAIESANGLGALLSQQLVGADEEVFDDPPTLSSRVRVLGTGKSQKNAPTMRSPWPSPHCVPRVCEQLTLRTTSRCCACCGTGTRT